MEQWKNVPILIYELIMKNTTQVEHETEAQADGLIRSVQDIAVVTAQVTESVEEVSFMRRNCYVFYFLDTFIDLKLSYVFLCRTDRLFVRHGLLFYPECSATMSKSFEASKAS